MNILNRTATREFILAMCEKYRPGWKFERVSGHAMDEAEAWLKHWIVEHVRQLPSTTHTVDFRS